jgi:hypothetical protein
MRWSPLAVVCLAGAVAPSGACKVTKTTVTFYDTGPTGPVDADGDGFLSDEDCDDEDATSFPGGVEVCDGANNDCDAAVDEDATDAVPFFRDADGDAHGNPALTALACSPPPGYTALGDDCDDAAPDAFPGADEVCNDGIDQDCDADLSDCVLAGAQSLDAAARLLGAEAGERAGTAVALVGDVTGDGVGDLAVGAPKRDAFGADAGAVYLVPGPFSGTLSLADAALVFTGGQEAANLGSAVAPAGDIDGDGVADLLLAADRAKAGGNDAGEVYLFLGPHTAGAGAYTADLRLIGEVAYDLAGGAIRGIPDATGDGTPDLLIGATGYGDGGFQNRGAIYVADGGARGIVDLGASPLRVYGESLLERLGASVDGADVNGDGVADLVAGAWGAPAGAAAGAVFVLYGPLSGNVSAADADVRLDGSAAGDLAGSAVAIGDHSGDGAPDLAVGAPGAGGGAGLVAVVDAPFRSGGLSSLAVATVAGTAGGEAAGASLVLSADWDGDGPFDLLVGAPGASVGGAGSGGAWAFYGPLAGARLTLEGDVSFLPADAGDGVGAALSAGRDASGDAALDVLLGAAPHDGGAFDAGAAFFVPGSRW